MANNDSSSGDNPDSSPYYAIVEMRYGRLDWLAEHIRRSDFQISPLVARQLLAMLEASDPGCIFELKASRRSDLPPRAVDSQLAEFRSLDMAVEVARLSGFKRGALKRACYEVGEKYQLKAEHVARLVRPHKQAALDIIDEEEAKAAYLCGEVDFLGRSKTP
jgi:hypothetical protein